MEARASCEIGVNDVDVEPLQAEPDGNFPHTLVQRNAALIGPKFSVLTRCQTFGGTDPDADRMGTANLTTAITCCFR